MIKANELRLGNDILLEKNGIKSPYKIISGHDIEEIEDNGEDCYPVPLTPEILEKCGLKNDDGYYHNQDYSFSLEERGNEYFYEYDGRNIGKGCKYLHQLQNLFFALTGEELEIKELQEN